MARYLAVIILIGFMFSACTAGLGATPTVGSVDQSEPTERVRPSHTPEDTLTPSATFPPVDLETLLPKVTPKAHSYPVARPHAHAYPESNLCPGAQIALYR
jgi:hypothetical protein